MLNRLLLEHDHILRKLNLLESAIPEAKGRSKTYKLTTAEYSRSDYLPVSDI